MIKKDFLLYFIGISGSGKTTIATLVEKKLKNKGEERLQFIDGDILREQLGGVFGYTKKERMKCNQVVRTIVQYLLQNHISVILAQVAAYEEMRICVRRQFLTQYIQVYVKCSVEECAKRDPKGYYRKVENGGMENLNGADEIFEIPNTSEIVVDTEILTAEAAAEIIVDYLEKNGYVI